MRQLVCWICFVGLGMMLGPQRTFGEELPREARDLIAEFEEDAEALRFETERKINEQKKDLLKKLKEIQDQYTRQAKLDEAVAIRDMIRDLESSFIPAQDDPGNLTAYMGQVGKRLYFKVTGTNFGTVYGTEFYTTDSSLGTAAVHAGVLKNGETAIVRVIILPGRDNYQSTTRNGVTSNAWSSYPGSYKVERIANFLEEEKENPDPPADKTLNGEKDAPKAAPPGTSSTVPGSFPGIPATLPLQNELAPR